MAKVISDEFIDGGLDAQAGAVTLTACAGQPTSQSDIAVKAIVSTTLTGGDWSIADGTPSGRAITMAQKAGITSAAAGTVDHVAVDDGTGYLVTTCAATAINIGSDVTFESFARTILDPS